MRRRGGVYLTNQSHLDDGFRVLERRGAEHLAQCVVIQQVLGVLGWSVRLRTVRRKSDLSHAGRGGGRLGGEEMIKFSVERTS